MSIDETAFLIGLVLGVLFGFLLGITQNASARRQPDQVSLGEVMEARGWTWRRGKWFRTAAVPPRHDEDTQ